MREIHIRRRMTDSRGCDAGYCYSDYRQLERTGRGCLSVEDWEYFSGGERYAGRDYALCGIRIEEDNPLVADYNQQREVEFARFIALANEIGIAEAMRQ